MTPSNGTVVPLRFDMSELVRRSVATLYSHLVTRPTGRAIRVGIEAQLTEMRGPCLSVLDFSNVVVLDYSCADETLAKLIARFLAEDRPAEAYFLARGIGERHRATVEAALERQGLALVAEIDAGKMVLLGEVTGPERESWAALERLGTATGPAELAALAALPELEVHDGLERLASRRLVLRTVQPVRYLSFSSLVRSAR